MPADCYTGTAVYNAATTKPGCLPNPRPVECLGTIQNQIDAFARHAPQLTAAHKLVPIWDMTSDLGLVAKAQPGERFMVGKEDGKPKLCALQAHRTKAQVKRLTDGFILDGIVGKESFGLYQPAQMAKDAAGVAALIPGATLSWAAVTRNGSHVLWSFDLGDVKIGGEAHNRTMTVRNGLDGSSKRVIIIHTRRISCLNMMASIIAEARRSNGQMLQGIKNTRGADKRTEKAWAEVAIALEQQGLVERKLGRLYKVDLPDAAVRETAELLAEQDGFSRLRTDGKTPNPRFEAQVGDILRHYNDPRASHTHLKGTLAGMMNAASYQRTHDATIPGYRTEKGLEEGLAAKAKHLNWTFSTLADSANTYLAVMDAIAEKTGIPLEDAGVHLGEALADPDGPLGVSIDILD